MVNIAHQPRGNQRTVPNSGFRNGQNRQNSRGGQGFNNPAKFGRQNVGNGNNKNSNRWNSGGGGPDRQNNRGRGNFNRGGFRNANGGQRFNPNLKKPWLQNNQNEQADENDLTTTQPKEFEEQPKQFNNIEAVNEESSSSESEEESSEGSDEMLDTDLSQSVLKSSDEEMESSENDEEDEISSAQSISNEDEAEDSNRESEMETSEEETPNDSNENEIAEEDPAYIFVKGLPATMKGIDQLRRFFGRYGMITNTRRRNFRDGTFTVILQYENKEDAEKALEVNGMVYEGNIVGVENVPLSEDTIRTIFIRKVPKSITRVDLWTTLESLYGPVQNVKLVSNPNALTNLAFVKFDSCDSKELATLTGKFKVKDHLLNPEECLARPENESKFGDRTGVPQLHNQRQWYTEFPRYNQFQRVPEGFLYPQYS